MNFKIKFSELLKGKNLILLVTVVAIVLVDQITKYLAVVNLKPLAELRPSERFVSVIDGFFRLKYAENPGAAWGLFRDYPDAFRIPFFIIISLLAIGIILWFFKKVEPKQKLLAIAFSLVMGGALGNLIDRIFLSKVVDFIDWYITFDSPHNLWLFSITAGEKHWPTFNIADAAITVGVIMLLSETFFGKGLKDPDKSNDQKKAKKRLT